jgi:hypothetical protein
MSSGNDANAIRITRSRSSVTYLGGARQRAALALHMDEIEPQKPLAASR